jgi:hypothetical protein
VKTLARSKLKKAGHWVGFFIGGNWVGFAEVRIGHQGHKETLGIILWGTALAVPKSLILSTDGHSSTSAQRSFKWERIMHKGKSRSQSHKETLEIVWGTALAVPKELNLSTDGHS